MTGSLVNLAPEIDSSAENFKVENQDPGEDVLETSQVSTGPSTVIKLLMKNFIFSSLLRFLTFNKQILREKQRQIVQQMVPARALKVRVIQNFY